MERTIRVSMGMEKLIALAYLGHAYAHLGEVPPSEYDLPRDEARQIICNEFLNVNLQPDEFEFCGDWLTDSD